MIAMVSRVTIFSLLLAAMLGLGICMYSQGEQDGCASHPATSAPPKSEYIVTGSREVEVPCSEWFLRQPLAVQILCIVEALLATLFLIHATGDVIDWARLRRRGKSA